MKSLHYFFLLSIIFGCTSNSEDKAPTTIEKLKDTIVSELSIDTVFSDTTLLYKSIDYSAKLKNPLHYFPEEIAALQSYFSDSMICSLDSNQFDLHDATSDSILLNVFEKSLQIRKGLLGELFDKKLPEEKNGEYYPDYIITELKMVEEASKALVSTCVAECTSFDFTFLLNDLLEKARSTSGELDDEFFQLLMIGDGNYGGTGEGWFTWFDRTWDYGGGSLLGSGIHLNFLTKSEDFKRKTSQFDFLLDSYIGDLLNDIKHGIYMNSRESIISELKEILNLATLTPENKKSISSFLQLLESGEENCKSCVDGKLQFDCATGNCNWGG